MAYDASSRKDIRKAEKDSRQADLIRADIIRGIMSQPLGRAYIYDRLAAAHIFHTSFNSDPLRMAFSEGERNVGLQLLGDIFAFCPQQFTLMLAERNAEDGRRTDDRHSGDNEGANGRDSPAAAIEDTAEFDPYSEPDVGAEGGRAR